MCILRVSYRIKSYTCLSPLVHNVAVCMSSSHAPLLLAKVKHRESYDALLWETYGSDHILQLS